MVTVVAIVTIVIIVTVVTVYTEVIMNSMVTMVSKITFLAMTMILRNYLTELYLINRRVYNLLLPTFSTLIIYPSYSSN